MELLVGEFINNVILHGHHPHQQARPGIHIKIAIEEDSVVIKVHDKGGEWHYEEKEQSGEDAWSGESKFATRGRGMKIIRELTAGTQRVRSRGVNETVFTITKDNT